MTGSGKTELALAVAKRLNGELICGDNTQMYEGLPTLTNKRKFDGSETGHHLYNRYPLDDQVDSLRYSADARAAIKDIQARGRVPILEGGSLFNHVQVFKGNSREESPEHADLMLKMRGQSRDMIRVLQRSDCEEEKASVDAQLCKLIEQVGYPEDAFDNMNLNDSFRLEQKIGQLLFLASTG